MHRVAWNRLTLRLAALLTGTTLLLDGCDPTIQQTVENGLISVSTSFLTALMQAVFQVIGQTGPAA